MKIPTSFRLLAPLVLLLAARVDAAPPAAPAADPFDKAVQAVMQNPAGAGEPQIVEVLRLARDSGRAFAANMAVKSWLARQPNVSPEVMLSAADVAVLAGDLRSASGRYKAFIAAAPAGEERSRAAARLYEVLIDGLGNLDDAYAFMSRQGSSLRQSAEARRFDPWFVEQSQARGDLPAMAAMLAEIMAQKTPLELERVLYWDRLDWLMNAIPAAKPEHFAAVPAARRIVGLLRESPARQARYAFLVAVAEYRAASAGRDDAGLAESFKPVAAAAEAYAKAVPTAATLDDVLATFANVPGDILKKHLPAVQACWVASFPSLPDAEKSAAINWQGWSTYQASPEQWVALGKTAPELFRASAGTRGFGFFPAKPDPAWYADQASFLGGVPAEAARLANSVAATKGTDFLAGLRHLSANETWYGGPGRNFLYETAQAVWNAWSAFPRQPAPTPADANAAWMAWAPDAIARTPAALLQPASAQQYLSVAWNASGADPGDKSKFAKHLRSLDWVPWDEKTRRDVIGPALGAYKSWANDVRKQASGRDKEKYAQAAALIAPLDDDFKKALDPAVSASADLANAADPLAGHLARCARAIEAKKLDDYVASARKAYALVRDYREKKTPWGEATLFWLLANRPKAFDTVDFQCEVIADQMAAWTPDRPNAAKEVIEASLFRDRPRWAAFSIPKDDAPTALKFNAAIGGGILAQLAKGHFDIAFLNAHRATRRGQGGWQNQQAGCDVLAKIIDSKILLKNDAWRRGAGDTTGATAFLQALVRTEYQGLAAKYPVETAFDDMFVEEFQAKPWLDPVFLSYSKDEKKKAAGLAARLFTTFQALATGSAAPLGFEQPTRRLASSGVITREPTWDASGVWFWHNAAFNAEKPLRDAVLTTATSAWGKTRFDGYAMGLPLLPGDQAVMQQPATRAEWFRTLATIVERGRAVPYRGNLPNMNALLGLNPATLTAEEMAVLLSVFDGGTPVAWPSGLGSEHLGRTVIAGLTALGRQADLARLAPQLWRIARDTGSGQFLAVMTGLATGLAKEGRTDIAASIADAGIEMFGTNMPEELRGQLAGVRAEAVLATGNANPVPRGDPRWAVYEAQIAFSAGKTQTAWDRYSTAAPVVQQMYKELDPEFLIWLVRENTATGGFDRARDLAQLLLASAEAVPGSLDTESQAALLVAYADIAMARREYPQARALYERITAAKEFDGTVGKRDAELRVAEVDRLTRQFDSARELLEKLTRRADKTLQAEAFFQLALVKTDLEEIEEAARDLDQVFMRVPNHVNGRILEGRLNLMRRKYDVASKVKLGTLGDRRTLIPGKPLEVDLEDKNLAVVGKATQIEIRAWTASGDEERFSLFPFGDSKTRFSGQLPTALGSPTKGDHTLQVAGGDTIHYGFADAVAKEAGGDETVSMTVVTDSGLFASSGEILSKEEQQERALERQIRDKLKIDDGLERKISLASARSDDQIKPGNSINVRVIDPDRSTSAQADTLTVRAATSSGDSLVTTLTETGPWTGVFEGTVPTGGSQPTAYASDSTDGNDPNWTIDPQGGTPWIGQPDSVRPKTLSIDLNDNVVLGAMQVTANVPGRRLKDVIVQTSLNGRVFRPVAQWRADGKTTIVPWDGAPMMELAPISVLPKAPMTAAAYAEYLGRGRYAKQAPLAMAKLPSMAVRMGEKLGELPTPLAMLPGVDTYVGHWYSGFTVPRKQVRTISLAPAAMKQPVTFLLTIDGTAGKADSPLAITRMLEKGAHRIDVYAIGRAAVPVGFDILVDSAEPPFTVPPPADFFDPAAHPEIAEAYAAVPATIKAVQDGTVFDIAFGPGTRARVVRFVIGDYETDAPAVNTITLTDADGKRVLPAPTSFAELAKNTTLEIIPGDRITIGYEDPATTTKALATQERFLTATFTNADFSAAFVEFTEDGQGGRRADYIPMRRFKPGDTVKVFINDPDMDTSEKPDTISFTARAGTGEPVTLEALETQPHSGIFVGTLFPVTGPPGRPSELTVRPGDDLRLGYVDRENTDPGIPWERVGYVEQIGSEQPELRVFDVASRPLDEKELSELKEKEVPGRKFEEVVPVTREIIAVRPEEPAAPGTAVKVLVDGPLLVELLAPRLAQSPKSAAAIYVQTQSGREKAGRTVSDGEFPLDVPGTIRISTTPSEPPAVTPPAGVRNVAIRGQEAVGDALTDGRYSFLVEKTLGPVPDRSLVDDDAKKNFGKPPVLQVRGNDTVYVGFRSGTAEGAEQWIVQPVALLSDVLFDIMDKRYQEPVTGVHVGDSLHVRIIHPALDTTDDKDSVTVRLKASNGGEMDLVLTETFGHSGVFKGAARLAYRDAAAQQTDAASADGRTLPVTYGETVAISYQLPGGGTLDRSVAVFKGGDAQVVPFTKQFKEPEIAVQTQFTVAEAWFELAKRHRELGQESLARREIAQGKKLLEEAINDYPNTQSRAQADYLLANLAFEFSKDSANEELAKQYAAEAVARFSDIVSSYPDSEYAPKSQFKKALVLEKLGQIDQACEEYVKLSYRYPDNELVAETIARLGQYFLSKGKDFDDRTKSLTDPVEREKVAIQGRDMFKTAAQVFSRLSERFPTHSLAGKTLMLSAQCYLRAGDLDRAVAGFERIYKDPKADKDLAAESMYWAGDVCLQKKDFKNAYRAFKKLTWDYPESKWAKFARGRLTEDALVQAAETEEKG